MGFYNFQQFNQSKKILIIPHLPRKSNIIPHSLHQFQNVIANIILISMNSHVILNRKFFFFLFNVNCEELFFIWIEEAFSLNCFHLRFEWLFGDDLFSCWDLGVSWMVVWGEIRLADCFTVLQASWWSRVLCKELFFLRWVCNVIF